jgi:hypothetical protein
VGIETSLKFYEFRVVKSSPNPNNKEKTKQPTTPFPHNNHQSSTGQTTAFNTML